MPELPEVETTRRGIEPWVVEQTILRVDIREKRLRWPVSNGLARQLSGTRIESVERRAKYLLFKIKRGYFIVHLGMSGSLRIVEDSKKIAPPQKHDHIDFILSNKKIIRFNDPRRFGCVLWLGEHPYEHKLLSSLGPEPFSQLFSGDYLFQCSRKRKVAVKNFIMNGHIVVGVGNIYASEALFLSGVRPTRVAARVSRKEYVLLAKNIVLVLNKSIEMGGTTLRDFVGGDGKPGYFKQSLNVYGREHEACNTCGAAIKLVAIGQRSSFYCPSCQK